MNIQINLPFPVSVNDAYRNKRAGETGPGRKKTKRATGWIRSADSYYMAQKRGVQPIHGHYDIELVLDCRKRITTLGKIKKIDQENFIKLVSDWLQRVELIDGDNLAERTTITWGHLEGCTVTVRHAEQIVLPETYVHSNSNAMGVV